MHSFLDDLTLYEYKKVTNYLSATKIDGGFLFHHRASGSSGTSFLTDAQAGLPHSLGYITETESALATIVSNTDERIPGMEGTPGAGDYEVTFNSQYELQGGNVTVQAAADLSTAYNDLMALPDAGGVHLPAFGTNETLLPGVYTIAAAGSLTGNINLDAQGNTDAIFIIRCGAAFAITAGSTVTLVDNAQACNVFWIAQGAITTGATSQLKGTLLVNGATGSITFGAGANLEGKALATQGPISTSNNTITNTPPCPSVAFGMVDSFAIFTSNGSIANTLASVINGDIGTNSGTVTGFGSATVNGTIYLPGAINNAEAFFSIYQNGVLVPNSSRRRELEINTVDITLKAIATVLDGESIEIKCRIDSGSILLENRVLIIKNLR
jgi:hypothetical protein